VPLIPEEFFFQHYNPDRRLVLWTLASTVGRVFESITACYVVGGEVHIMKYDPARPSAIMSGKCEGGIRPPSSSLHLKERIEKDFH